MNENPESPKATDPQASDTGQGECPRTEPGASSQPTHVYGAEWTPGAQPHPTSAPPVATPPAVPPPVGTTPVAPPPAHSPWPSPHFGPPPPQSQGHWGPPSWPPTGGTGHWSGGASPRPANRKRGMLATALALLLAVTALLGVLVGHTVWPNATATSGVQNTGIPFHYGSNGSTSTSGPNGSSSGSGSAASIAAKVDPGLVDVNTKLSLENPPVAGAGTGMVLTSNGIVLTNNHVVEGETSITVTDIGNGKTYSATVVGYDRSADVAVLQLANASGLSTVTLASSGVSKGEQVVAIGNAGGTGGTPTYSVRHGHCDQPVDHSI